MLCFVYFVLFCCKGTRRLVVYIGRIYVYIYVCVYVCVCVCECMYDVCGVYGECYMTRGQHLFKIPTLSSLPPKFIRIFGREESQGLNVRNWREKNIVVLHLDSTTHQERTQSLPWHHQSPFHTYDSLGQQPTKTISRVQEKTKWGK